MTVEVIDDNLIPQLPVQRQPERRRMFDPIDTEMRQGAGSRETDLEYQARLAEVFGLELPSYLLATTFNAAHEAQAEGEAAIVEEAISILKNEIVFEDTFNHWVVTPKDPEAKDVLPLAWQTHAAGYLRTGLAKPPAVKDGMLTPMIDKSRHVTEGMTYYVAQNPDVPSELSTARLIDAPTVEELPTFVLTGEGISEDGMSALKEAVASGVRLREVGALANSNNGYCRGATEILRQIIVDTVSNPGRGKQLLFCSMVDRARAGLMQTLAPDNFKAIGDPSVLDENEYRKETTLIPLLIDPDSFVANLYEAYKNAESPSTKRRFLESALYFAEPLAEEFVPADLVRIRAALQPNVDTQENK